MERMTKELLAFIEKSPSAFHVVEAAKKMLQTGGFEELSWDKAWKLQVGGRYFTSVYGSTLFVFQLGKDWKRRLLMAAAHTDFPGFRVKPAAEIVRKGYGSLNVEPYGGMILSTWLDRPLSLAGKVALRGKDAFSPEVRLVDFVRPLMTIPSLAIHMNRKVNEGVAINAQKDMLPLAARLEESGKDAKFFQTLLAQEMHCAVEKILSYDLTLYPAEKGCCFGFSQEFISSPRLDNLTSVKACLDGILTADIAEGIKVAALFDNEEVGSRTKQGAGSAILRQLLERIYAACGASQEELFAAIGGGFMLSTDVAHALHPNYQDKMDPTNQPVLNGGLVLKRAASQSYAGDAEAIGIVAELCRQHQILCQHFVNRSDSKGGSTLGSIASALVPVRTMDIGIPMLAMHSARETMGAADQKYLTNLLGVFFAAH